MVPIIIFTSIIILLYLFNKDKKEMLSNIKANGGLMEKYKDFVSFFVDKHGFKMTELTNQQITLQLKETNVNMQVVLIQSFNKALVRWHSNNIAGTVKMNWEFPEFMNQESMVEKIMSDVLLKQQNNINKAITGL